MYVEENPPIKPVSDTSFSHVRLRNEPTLILQVAIQSIRLSNEFTEANKH